MTGSGSGTLIFGREDTFMGGLIDADADTNPDLYAFGRDPTLTELSLDNQLERLEEGDSVWSKESLKQNFAGAVAVDAVVSADVFKQVEKIVFNSGGTDLVSGLTASARVFTGVEYPSGTAERELYGCVPIEFALNWEQGGMLSYSLTMAYADEQPGASADLTTATRVTDGSSVPFHGVEFTVDAATVSDLQSATLTISDIGRMQYGASPTPNRGVVANPQATLDLEAIFTTASRLDLARGSATGSLSDTISSVTGSIDINAADGTSISTYNLAELTPATYSWNNVVSSDDTTDSTTFNVDDGVSVA